MVRDPYAVVEEPVENRPPRGAILFRREEVLTLAAQRTS